MNIARQRCSSRQIRSDDHQSNIRIIMYKKKNRVLSLVCLSFWLWRWRIFENQWLFTNGNRYQTSDFKGTEEMLLSRERWHVFWFRIYWKLNSITIKLLNLLYWKNHPSKSVLNHLVAIIPAHLIGYLWQDLRIETKNLHSISTGQRMFRTFISRNCWWWSNMDQYC
jgi:hypothetical protein